MTDRTAFIEKFVQDAKSANVGWQNPDMRPYISGLAFQLEELNKTLKEISEKLSK